jgi:hypothetical protein
MKIVPACSALLSTVLVLACSDGKEDEDDGTDSGDLTSDGGSDGSEDGTSDDGGTGSGGGSDDGGDDGGTGSGGASDTGDSGTTSGDDGTTSGGTGTTSGQGNLEYAARAMPGGLDRIFIRKADYDEDLCGHLALVWPSEPPGPFPDVTTPTQWAVEIAAVFQGTTDCLDLQATPPGASEYADTVSGYVDFEFNNPGFYPCSLDLDVTMTFAPVAPQPWIPDALTMAALDLAVEGC